MRLRLAVGAVQDTGVQHRAAGVIGLAAIFLDVATSTSFINFGAFTAFTLLPAIGAAVDVYLLTQLDSRALFVGLCWMAVGVIYLLVLTPRLHPRAAGGDRSDRSGKRLTSVRLLL